MKVERCSVHQHVVNPARLEGTPSFRRRILQCRRARGPKGRGFYAHIRSSSSTPRSSSTRRFPGTNSCVIYLGARTASRRKNTRVVFRSALFLPQHRLGQVDSKPPSRIFTRCATRTSFSRRAACQQQLFFCFFKKLSLP